MTFECFPSFLDLTIITYYLLVWSNCQENGLIKPIKTERTQNNFAKLPKIVEPVKQISTSPSPHYGGWPTNVDSLLEAESKIY